MDNYILTIGLIIAAYLVGRRHGYVAGIKKAIEMTADNIRVTLKNAGLSDPQVDGFFAALSRQLDKVNK